MFASVSNAHHLKMQQSRNLITNNKRHKAERLSAAVACRFRSTCNTLLSKLSRVSRGARGMCSMLNPGSNHSLRNMTQICRSRRPAHPSFAGSVHTLQITYLSPRQWNNSAIPKLRTFSWKMTKGNKVLIRAHRMENNTTSVCTGE